MNRTLENVWQVIMAGEAEFIPLPEIPAQRTLVVTFPFLAGKIRRDHPEIPPDNILLEPHKRGTATCIALAMYTLLKRAPEAIMVAVPSDLQPWDDAGMMESVKNAIGFVRENDVLMTIGLRPLWPDVRYGYIQTFAAPVPGEPQKVKTFTEKPPEEFARIFFDSGEFLWNSGMFIWKADTIRGEYERYLPMTVALFKGWEGAIDSPLQNSFLEKAYVDCSRISVDRAIMERTQRAWVYPVSIENPLLHFK